MSKQWLKLSITIGLLSSPYSTFAVRSDYESALKLRHAIEHSRSETSAVETIKLPTSRGFNQGGTSLCWSYSTLNVLESSWLARHPDTSVELSRRTMQYLTMKDRFTSYIKGTSNYLSERGTSVDAMDLIQGYGLVAFSDFKDISDSYGHNNIRRAIDAVLGESEKLRVLDNQLSEKYGVPPQTTHLGEQGVSVRELADIITRRETWISFTPTTDGSSGWRKHPDPDARPQAKSYALPQTEVTEKIKWALSHNYAVEYSNDGHSITIYGADYDSSGHPTNYYVKDSYPDYFYTASPSKMMANMMEVTIPNAEYELFTE